MEPTLPARSTPRTAGPAPTATPATADPTSATPITTPTTTSPDGTAPPGGTARRPVTSMHTYDDRLADLVFDYMRGRLQLDPVPLDHPGSRDKLERVLNGLLGPTGRDPAEVLAIYADHLAPAVISCDSPRFLSFIPAAPTKAALLFDMVVSCASLQGISWLEAAGAVAAENQVLRLIADQAGMPAQAGGCFVTGGSAGNLAALVVARDTGLRRLAEPDATGTPRQPPPRVRIAVGEQAHSSIASTLRIIGADPLVVPSPDHRMTGRALRQALARDPAPGDVVAVVATAGTTNAGIVDDLAGVAEVAREHGMWFHVDGAYGGAALFAPSVRERFAGIEHADSLVVDPHKWLFAPFDCAALLYRRPRLAKAVHTQDASYLDVIHTDSPEEWNPTDYAYHLTRRARGLPLWFSLAVHGTDAYRDAIEAALTLAREAAELVRRAPHVELVREPELSVVLLRRPGWAPEDYHAWSERLLAGQVAFVTPTTWQGETVARLAFLHPGTTTGVVREILATME
ncbi:pyridoxal phosphate-dependent decarboxylase family protein [Allostreptomyces psammosilenae]|uniref:Glutamate/tyrosine decarboxylase-like PLP-dependent enzyme n=1 Tax=Allostreptomyces psammosilenae TaxID=1892865 RepID=A0A853A008_9ACTN|nr:pyridoxal-dependent decarboxylase [Allostreptomyces psammosilenae]NYI07963.1 glutamate/tyrosine decarboxylase-like PLP-dependent enzyme [Allostreptomyces psammosilenae]